MTYTTQTLSDRSPAYDGHISPSHSTCPRGLFGLVLQAVESVVDREELRRWRGRAGETCQPEALLALLTYCFATGIYSPRAVAEQAQSVPELRCLFEEEVPDGEVIGCFEDLHRATLNRCVDELVRQALRIRFGGHRDEAPVDNCVAEALDRWFEMLCVPFPHREPQTRIETMGFVHGVVID